MNIKSSIMTPSSFGAVAHSGRSPRMNRPNIVSPSLMRQPIPPLNSRNTLVGTQGFKSIDRLNEPLDVCKPLFEQVKRVFKSSYLTYDDAIRSSTFKQFLISITKDYSSEKPHIRKTVYDCFSYLSECVFIHSKRSKPPFIDTLRTELLSVLNQDTYYGIDLLNLLFLLRPAEDMEFDTTTHTYKRGSIWV